MLTLALPSKFADAGERNPVTRCGLRKLKLTLILVLILHSKVIYPASPEHNPSPNLPSLTLNHNKIYITLALTLHSKVIYAASPNPQPPLITGRWCTGAGATRRILRATN